MTVRPFAQGTVVSISKTRAEIEDLVTRSGEKTFASGLDLERAAIQFDLATPSARVTIRFALPLAGSSFGLAELRKPRRRFVSLANRPAEIQKLYESENRRRWRCLLLAIKSKLESVASGIETIEQAFLAQIVTSDGRTVHERVLGTPWLALPEKSQEARSVDAIEATVSGQ